MRRLLGLVFVFVGSMIGKEALKSVPQHCTPRPHRGDGSLYIQVCTRAGTNHDVPWWIGAFLLVAGVLMVVGRRK